MPQKGRYYLGRVIKLGNLDQTKLIQALKEPTPIPAGEFAWTITHYKRFSRGENQFVFGRLNKYKPKGTVSIVDPKLRQELERDEPNLSVASSPFVYIPEFSGIAYLHVWNQIHQPTFVRRIIDIVLETHGRFFVDCKIEAVTDLRIFARRLAALTTIKEIHARINPPNPLFGDLWESLKDLMERRNCSQMNVDEFSPPNQQLNTNLPKLVDFILDESNEKPPIVRPPEISDAAVLMAADGYGIARVTGIENATETVIRTSDNVKTFQFSKEPDPIELYQKASEIFRSTSQERNMKHGSKKTK